MENPEPDSHELLIGTAEPVQPRVALGAYERIGNPHAALLQPVAPGWGWAESLWLCQLCSSFAK